MIIPAPVEGGFAIVLSVESVANTIRSYPRLFLPFHILKGRLSHYCRWTKMVLVLISSEPGIGKQRRTGGCGLSVLA